jgi:hypothetical protein
VNFQRRHLDSISGYSSHFASMESPGSRRNTSQKVMPSHSSAAQGAAKQCLERFKSFVLMIVTLGNWNAEIRRFESLAERIPQIVKNCNASHDPDCRLPQILMYGIDHCRVSQRCCPWDLRDRRSRETSGSWQPGQIPAVPGRFGHSAQKDEHSEWRSSNSRN